MVVYCLGDRARGRCAGELEVELVFRCLYSIEAEHNSHGKLSTARIEN